MKMKKKIEFKLEEELFNSYKELCERNGLDMSKRLRLFIESEIKHDEKGENIINKLQS
jgi:antitoxin component of RelBE/YafQ-DinJ toxin-antitoxin module